MAPRRNGAGSPRGSRRAASATPGIPIAPPESAQDIEVQFEPEGTGTRLTLTHTGWERLGKEARKARRGYPIGWQYVMAIYAGRKGPLVYALDLVGMIMRLVQR